MDYSRLLSTCFFGIIIFVLYKVYNFIRSVRLTYKLFKDTPGPKDFHWFYGSLHLVKDKTSDERLEFFEDLNIKFPRYFVLWFGPFKPQIFLNHSDTIKTIFKTSEPKNVSSGGVYHALLPWLGEGLLVANGNRWARSRRLLTPAFHFDILKPYISVYNDSAELLMDEVARHATNCECFELFQVISSCTLDVILKCACSYDTGCQQSGKTHPYVEAVNELARLVDERGRNIFLANDLIFYLSSKGRRFRKYCRYVHNVAEEIIQKRRKDLEEKGVPTRKYLDFLDILLTAKDHDGIGLTNQEIRNEVDTFLFEGHDTTASGIAWILYHLANNPEHQRKCQDEIDTVLRDRQAGRIEWDELPKLEYLTMCIKEGMRLSAPVPGVARELSQDMEIDGREFPIGTPIVLFMHLVHINPEIWKDPLVYDPSRFSKENIVDMDPFAFCPFAAGPRNCIGQYFALNEEKVILARFLHRYSIELDPSHKLVREVALIFRSANDIRVRIKERNGLKSKDF